mmetsp:Transcript_70723/g.121420  ORF Transcript_70723/g.121420 Transcript_70723/m.121420 type:complete len:296 (-) Transcript_70723:85-972(-)
MLRLRLTLAYTTKALVSPDLSRHFMAFSRSPACVNFLHASWKEPCFLHALARALSTSLRSSTAAASAAPVSTAGELLPRGSLNSPRSSLDSEARSGWSGFDRGDDPWPVFGRGDDDDDSPGFGGVSWSAIASVIFTLCCTHRSMAPAYRFPVMNNCTALSNCPCSMKNSAHLATVCGFASSSKSAAMDFSTSSMDALELAACAALRALAPPISLRVASSAASCPPALKHKSRAFAVSPAFWYSCTAFSLSPLSSKYAATSLIKAGLACSAWVMRSDSSPNAFPSLMAWLKHLASA